DVPIHFEGRLVVKFSDEIDEYDGEVMWISPSASEVDLAQYIYESIVLSLPYQRVHPEGMCDPEMLARFKIVSDAEFAAIEARQRAENAAESSEGQSEEWKKLEALRVQLALDERDKNKE
ncbi:MAG: YceD family protein, partial [Alistipes sp.]